MTLLNGHEPHELAPDRKTRAERRAQRHKRRVHRRVLRDARTHNTANPGSDYLNERGIPHDNR